MNLGELIFNLGFKTTGKEAATAFEKTIKKTKESANDLASAFTVMGKKAKTANEQIASSVEYLAFLFEEFAIKNGILAKAQAYAEQKTIDESLALERLKSNSDRTSGSTDKLTKNTESF